MKLMSLVKGLVLAAMLACIAHAHQMVIWVDGTSRDDIRALDRLLKQGWHITHVSIAVGSNGRLPTTVFVLESPTKETVK